MFVFMGVFKEGNPNKLNTQGERERLRGILKILEESCEGDTSPGILGRNCSHVTCRIGDQADAM